MLRKVSSYSSPSLFSIVYFWWAGFSVGGPLATTPVLVAPEGVLFESNAIARYGLLSHLLLLSQTILILLSLQLLV
jgi:hypothetical protein